MSIEEAIYKRYSPDYKKLVSYGFQKKNKNFSIEKIFFDNQFKAVIEVVGDTVCGTVYDLENNDEYLPLRLEYQEGSFVSEVRASYEEVLTDIRQKCFVKNYYIFPQSNRITDQIIKKYGDEPEFLWEKFQGSGIFRNPKTQKWYAAILDVDRSRLQKGKKGLIEVIDIKLSPEHVEEIINIPNFYQGYHMNKKYWISVILDDSVEDEKIMELVEESHLLSLKK